MQAVKFPDFFTKPIRLQYYYQYVLNLLFLYLFAIFKPLTIQK
ncbi:hypothetical protein MHA_2148 [Mannheimia haemolytica PHL213]|nr:hypothetical protein MHA_2148 [Mannheimia haemolytica PHL213]